MIALAALLVLLSALGLFRAYGSRIGALRYAPAKAAAG
jgi:hypothetical protein